MKRYELIDRTDNDSHDEGTRDEITHMATVRNEDDAAWLERATAEYDALMAKGSLTHEEERRRIDLMGDLAEADDWPKGGRWVCKPEGYSATNWKG